MYLGHWFSRERPSYAPSRPTRGQARKQIKYLPEFDWLALSALERESYYRWHPSKMAWDPPRKSFRRVIYRILDFLRACKSSRAGNRRPWTATLHLHLGW